MGNAILAPAYFVLLFIGAGYFLIRRRVFDLFAVAFGGAAFYFLPLLAGYVPDWNGSRPFSVVAPLSTGTYMVGFLFTSAIPVGAAIFDAISPQSKMTRDSSSSLSNWYIGIALAGLFGAALSGQILDRNKAFVLTQVGYWFVLFQSGAALACIDAFFYKKRTQLLIAALLLSVDIVIGFRSMTVMCFLTLLLIDLGSRGKITLWRSIPFVAVATSFAFFSLLTVNNIREVSLRHFGVKLTEIGSEAQSTLPAPPDEATSHASIRTDGVLRSASDLAGRVPRLIAQMEPFVTQAILSEVTRHNFRCHPSQIRNLALIIPFAGRFVGGPTIFETQFKPAFFPNFWAGMAGNAWAEVYCDFGYTGVAVEIVLVVMLIGIAQILITRTPSSAVPAIVLSGVLIAFYIHRNDLLFELLLIRRVAMIFILASIFRATALFSRSIIGGQAKFEPPV